MFDSRNPVSYRCAPLGGSGSGLLIIDHSFHSAWKERDFGSFDQLPWQQAQNTSARQQITAKGAKLENINDMAAVNSAVILSLVEELTDDAMLLEASSCDGDKEFLLFLLITCKERENHIRMTVTLKKLYGSIVCQIFKVPFRCFALQSLFGRLASCSPRSFLGTKEWWKTYHWLTEASFNNIMDTWEPWMPEVSSRQI